MNLGQENDVEDSAVALPEGSGTGPNNNSALRAANKAETETSVDIELLVRKVFELLRHELRIERERRNNV